VADKRNGVTWSRKQTSSYIYISFHANENECALKQSIKTSFQIVANLLSHLIERWVSSGFPERRDVKGKGKVVPVL
jgi:hypothetical protein